MIDKYIEIDLKRKINPHERKGPWDDEPLRLFSNEYPHIYLDHEVSKDEVEHAIDTIITFFMQKDLKNMTVDLDRRENALKPPVELTLEEIEKKLGYKVKVVSEKEE